MFKSWWRLLSYEGSLTKHIFTASLKFCRSGKPFNVLKSVNTENKYLFGRLLETQKQRRRAIRKQTQSTEEGSQGVINTKNNISGYKDEAADVVPVNANNCIGKKKKPRSLKLSATDIDNSVVNDQVREVSFSSVAHAGTDQPVSPSNGTITNNNIEVKTVKNAEIINANNLDHNTTSTKKGTKKKLKTQSNVPNPSNSLGNVDDDNVKVTNRSSVSQYIFKPTLQINELNFPLESREKLSADDLEKQSPISFGFNDPEIKGYATYPSVSKIIEETMSSKSRMILNKWKENMIKELGQEGFNEHNIGCVEKRCGMKVELKQRTMSLHVSIRNYHINGTNTNSAKERGSQFHGAVRDAVMGRSASPDGHSEVTRNAMRSLAWLMEHISCPLAVESITAHPTLRYKGVPDCVAKFRNIPVVVDWKLSDKPKKDLKDTYDAPVQITAYIGALNHDPNYTWKVNHGLVAVAYANGDPCDVFLLAPKHCQIYWRHWLMRFDKFKARSHLHLEHNIDERDLSLD